LQDTQIPSHALSQHTPSTQKPEAQALALEQAVPFFVLQLPPVPHACPGQLPGTSVPGTTAVQVPSWPATAQDWQDPEQAALPQQTPSTQKPEAQFDSVAAVQPSPLPRFVTLYSQTSPLSVPAPTSTVTPRLLSKTMRPDPGEAGPVDRERTYQVGPLVSSSMVLTAVVAPVRSFGTGVATCRRRKLS
jgi:hypothetical protein